MTKQIEDLKLQMNTYSDELKDAKVCKAENKEYEGQRRRFTARR